MQVEKEEWFVVALRWPKGKTKEEKRGELRSEQEGAGEPSSCHGTMSYSGYCYQPQSDSPMVPQYPRISLWICTAKCIAYGLRSNP